MSKPPSDTFTRFTSTSPHASSNPSSAGTSSSSSSFTYQPPSRKITPSSTSTDNETPKERVARLRAAARAAKTQQALSPVDRIIDRGRLWADNAHRIVAYGLIGFTGISTMVALFGLTSLVTHNRRQKRAWIEREMQRLTDAQSAFLSGAASPEQLHLLEQQRAGEELVTIRERDKALKKERSIWNRVKNAVGMSGRDMGREDAAAWQEEEARRGIEAGKWDGAGGQGSLLKEGWADEAVISGGSLSEASKSFDEPRRRIEGPIEAATRSRGVLDELAGNVANAMTPRGDGSWPSWLRNGKS